MGHLLNIFNHTQKLLVDLGIIFMTELASNTNTSRILVNGSSKLIAKI